MFCRADLKIKNLEKSRARAIIILRFEGDGVKRFWSSKQFKSALRPGRGSPSREVAMGRLSAVVAASAAGAVTVSLLRPAAGSGIGIVADGTKPQTSIPVVLHGLKYRRGPNTVTRQTKPSLAHTSSAGLSGNPT